MRRGPEEDDHEHRHGFEADAPRRHGPADHRREGTGCTADNDVLRRAALEPDGIDDDVEEDREGQEGPREDVRGQRQHHAGNSRQRQAEAKRLALAHTARRDRAVRGAAHDAVDIRVIPHVQRARGTAAKRDEQDRGEGDEGMHRHRRHHQPDKGGEDDERHHARLQQGDEIAELSLTGAVDIRDVAHLARLSSKRLSPASRSRRRQSRSWRAQATGHRPRPRRPSRRLAYRSEPGRKAPSTDRNTRPRCRR